MRYSPKIKNAQNRLCDHLAIKWIDEKEKNFLFDIEKKVQVEIGFSNIKTGSSHFLCDYGLDTDTKKWYKTSI